MKKFKSLIVRLGYLVTSIFLMASFNVSATLFRNKENKEISTRNLFGERLIDKLYNILPNQDLIVNRNYTSCIVDRRISNGNIIHVTSYGVELIVDKVVIDIDGNEYFFYKIGGQKQRFEDCCRILKSKKIKFFIKHNAEEYIASLFDK